MKSRAASSKRRGRRGFTTLELIVVMTIFAVSVATVTPFLGRFQESQSIKSHAQNVVQVLRRAQHRAITGERDLAWGVRFSTGSYILFAGTSYAGRNIRFDETHSLSTVIHWSGLPEAVFSKGTGTPVTPGTVTLSRADGITDSIVISASGMISLP